MPKKGQKHNPDTIKKISQSRKGKPAWNKDKNWSDIQRLVMGIGRKGDFKWIEDKDFKNLVTRDFATAKECEKHGMFKPATILYAAVIESMLRLKLNINPQEKIDLHDLIEEGSKQKLIKDHEKDKLNVIRGFRNYVHIYREYVDKYPLTQGLAQLTREVCEELIKEFNK
ncbi:MAG: hypothetical protein ACD_19C00391G0001 [uncultured bacterium]|uniref:DUF4145 domain-containing protein n=1 Tax=Candidatus Gottesmanbacteria bacterium GW2011_GWB1_43_11 TaxID=1618446 RepID=A0A0G1CMX1_9BACT|nr:MAG: hypothetical protein ACD_19C00391G0001 [uncultured bacterium]KKS41685.1 MAG: hypothetical protein UV04_C0005G0037 [Candidatus Gottesmanbacteria bacterium GW2011_GWA2_42_16]KKS55382.1 MAG: hypothetical protein UV17_C0011G0007 [Candidatus Gottesmanbacteria bacterium GW2011_GWA1_42_26]KKS81917.1 MAG: hypothetical protein UV55_C0007G0038 [Candidatus Gottesmanbacteria bacterium GW2011_GWC1_43_10]KKS86837.1 MAG: hypothetical protein UV61_C0006G0038 [Candidatus Gottesmanbacteria bacterium GW20